MLDLLQARLEKCDSPEAILLLCHFMNEHFGEYIDAWRETKGVKNYRLDSSSTALCFVTYSIAEVLEADERKKVLVKYRDEIDRMQDELEELEDLVHDREIEMEGTVDAVKGVMGDIKWEMEVKKKTGGLFLIRGNEACVGAAGDGSFPTATVLLSIYRCSNQQTG
ncbi:uncharacterized protein BDV14DRAFT_176759 [Aspergillus stella-maris]|uniref:uncharacterized protein n=1 Tax=Aspergillus stella-maris TaxID=1810926 RepID=UPI003CCD46FF